MINTIDKSLFSFHMPHITQNNPKEETPHKKTRQLFLLRGLPNSGKTTVANSLFKKKFAADDYHMKNGHYDFDINKIGEAHKDCQMRVECSMRSGSEKIVVHNTSTTFKELKPYYNLAEKYAYEVFSLIVEKRHKNGDNGHNVPQETLDKMRKRFEIKL